MPKNILLLLVTLLFALNGEILAKSDTNSLTSKDNNLCNSYLATDPNTFAKCQYIQNDTAINDPLTSPPGLQTTKNDFVDQHKVNIAPPNVDTNTLQLPSSQESEPSQELSTFLNTTTDTTNQSSQTQSTQNWIAPTPQATDTSTSAAPTAKEESTTNSQKATQKPHSIYY
jgi:hypothetical protein